MDFPNYFADAEEDGEHARFVIAGVPFEKTSSFRHGADQGPDAIRQASWNFEQYDLRTQVNMKDIPVHDYGNLDVHDSSSRDVFEATKKYATRMLEKKKILITMGGDHSITPGLVSAFPKDTAVLSLDAHMDYRQKYKNDVYNHACVIKRIADHLDVHNIAVFGIRSAEKEEYDLAQQHGLFFLDAFTIKKMGMQKALQQTREHLKQKNIYLTIDIDVVDPAFAPGTSTPEPFGLHPFDILDIIDLFSPQLISLDLVEVCPPYDHGQTAVLAAKLIRSAMGAIWKHQKE